MDYYEANLRLLVRKEPELARRIERVRVGNLSYHLPIEKVMLNVGNDLARANTIVIFGFGSGVHVRQVLRSIGRKSFVLVIDPDVEGFRRTLFLIDLTPILSSKQLSISIGEDPFAATRVRIDEFYKIATIGEMEIVPYPPAIRDNRGYFEKILAHLKDVANGAVQNRATLVEFVSQWQNNLLSNLPSMVAYPGINTLFERFKNAPAIILGAGPSLDKDLEELSKIRGRGLTIASDTALPTLLNKGVEPDLVLALDGGEANCKHFQGVRPKRTALVAVSITHPRIVSEFPGPVFMADFAHPLNQWISLFIGQKGYLKTGGSVVTTCFDLATRLGCNPIILTGVDLAFTGGATHSSGSFYIQEMLGDLSKFHTLEMMHRKKTQDENTLWIEGNNGRKLLTSHKYLTYLRWLESQIGACPERTFINTALDGARIAGTTAMSLSEVAEKFLHDQTEVEGVIKELQSSYHSPSPTTLEQAIIGLLKEWESAHEISSRGRDLSVKLVNLLDQADGAREKTLLRELSPLYQGIIRRAGFMRIARLNLEPLLRRMEEGSNGADPLVRARACKDFFSSIADYCQASIKQFGHTKDGLKMLCPR